MVFVIGGAYQGKLEWAMDRFALTPMDIFACEDADIDFSKRCIDHLETFTMACIRAHLDPVAYFEQNASRWTNSILICQDVFCGVVPVDAQLRLWRNETGRLCQYLARNAQQVSRIFCGLEQRLK